MNNLNQDIQASYQIIQLLEKSKQNSELIIESLPDVFMVIDANGKIYKANKEACRFLKLDAEQVLGYSLSSGLQTEHWNLIEGNLESLTGDTRTFEIPIFYEGTEKVYLWSLTVFGTFKNSDSILYTLQGRDVTLLRLYQRKINDIFASIPLGIFTVNSNGTIEDAFSEYSKWILGRSDIAGRSLRELLYEPAVELMDVATRSGFKSLMESINRPVLEFEVLSSTFPKQFYFPLPHSISEKGRYLGIKVQSITRGDRVSGLLVVIEDRTLIVEAEKMDEKYKLLQDLSIERALQLKKADPELVNIVFQDLAQLFNELGDCVLTQTSSTFMNSLHSIKANARLIGLSNLQKLSHSFETKLREDTMFSWDIVFSNIDTLLQEWREVLSLRKVLASSAVGDASATNSAVLTRSIWQMYKNALQDKSKQPEFENYLKVLSRSELGSLEAPLRGISVKAAERTDKRVNMIFNWDRDVSVDVDLLASIRTCLIHIVNNAVDHGLEEASVRTSKGKSLTGLIHLGSINSREGLIIFVEDDGRGLDRNKIEKKALKNGLITEEQQKILSDSEIFDLVFYPGFSTKESVSDLSGRGVGLAAVREICVKSGGNCKASVGKSGLTRFELHFVVQE
ncbi:MAG: PAS domain-containing protein [Bdellovibrio sp.]|nr:PAS domain-containing protein [Bdellovibrio sp.]